MTASLAPKPPFAAPTIDRLDVCVVVDSAYDLFPPKQEHGDVRIEHFKRKLGSQMSTLACEWGLSLHLTSKKAGAIAQHVLDFGYTPEIINRNFDLLDIDPAKIDGLILSHAHRDHYGGLTGFVMQHRRHMPSDLSFYVGGEEAFREKWVGEKEKPVSWGVVDRMMLAAHKVSSCCCSEPHDIKHAFTTGYIPRNSFETVSGGSMIVADDQPYSHFTEAELSGKLVKDLHPDEHATCYIIQGKGLVVITSCGHVGLINTTKAAMAVSGVSKLHAVIGGFHLGPAPLEYIEQTITELEALDPDVVVPMHCSGANFIRAMQRRMPEKLVTSNVGARFTFGG
ncbi:MAG: MBL fold metallo-hydrolase [Hyphomicrobiaceae bacterium]|nr:MBL fold metallo-hydrolase [Hyphomicrobiaceae bacterium]